MFTDPELARIGLSETEAKERGVAYRLTKTPMVAVFRAQTLSETRGFMKASLMPRATASSALQPLELEQETPWRQSRSQCWRDSLIPHCVTPFLLIQLYRKVSFRFLQMCRPRQIEKQRTINQ